MDKNPHMFITADSTWDPLVLDNEFEEEFYNAVTELPEVKERHDGADPRVDDYGFLWSRQDYELLFCAQDEFIAANANATDEAKQEIFCDASMSGVTYYDDPGTVIHNYAPMTYFETMVAKLSAAPNQVRKLCWCPIQGRPPVPRYPRLGIRE